MKYLDSFLCLLVSLQLVLKVMSSVVMQIQGHKWMYRSVQDDLPIRCYSQCSPKLRGQFRSFPNLV